MNVRIFLPLFAISLFSCKNYSNYQGQYAGTLVQSGQQKNVVVFVSETTLKKKRATLVSVNEVDASKPPLLLEFELKSRKALGLKYQGQSYHFNLEDRDPCVQGEGEQSAIKLCLNKNEVILDLSDSSHPESSLKIAVTKLDELPRFKTQASYTMGELLGRAKFLNYKVEQRAQTVYQAREKISVAMGNLIPHISLMDVWELSSGSPIGFIGTIGNLVPFIFPSNWFEFREAKELYQAELKSYASLRGNEMNAVQGLIYMHMRNTHLLKKVEEEIAWLQNVLQNVEVMEQAKTAPQGSAERVSIKLGTLLLDKVQIEEFLQLENSEIAQATSLSTISTLPIEFPAIPALDKVSIATADNCLASVSQKSFEADSLDDLIKASDADVKVRKFSYLDPSSGELNFSIPANIRIGKSYKKELGLKRKELTSLLQKRCMDTVAEKNKTIRSYKIATQYLKNVTKLRDILAKKMILEGDLSPEHLAELMENADDILKYESQRLSAAVEFLISEGKMERLMLEGPYKDLGVGL